MIYVFIFILFGFLNQIRGRTFQIPFLAFVRPTTKFRRKAKEINKEIQQFLKLTPKILLQLTFCLIAWIAVYYLAKNSENSLIIASIFVLGLFNWFIWGWGKYFMAFHGRDYQNETECFFIDVISDLILGKPRTKSGIRNKYTLVMSIRGLYIYPAFLALQYYLSYSYIIGFLILFQGFIYGAMRWVPERYSLYIAEFFTGGLIGVMIALNITLG